MKIIDGIESKKWTERNKVVAQAIVKVWELNHFVVFKLDFPINMSSFFNF